MKYILLLFFLIPKNNQFYLVEKVSNLFFQNWISLPAQLTRHEEAIFPEAEVVYHVEVVEQSYFSNETKEVYQVTDLAGLALPPTVDTCRLQDLIFPLTSYR